MKPVVYLIDDDEGQIALLTAQLERSRDFVTKGFTDPEKALEHLLAEPPDIVLSDLVMPGIDGIEVTRRIREFDTTLPVIIATGKGSAEDAERAYDAGATDFVTKPIDPGTLIARMKRALEIAPAQELLEDAQRIRFDPHGIIGEHPRVQAVRSFIDHVASVPRVSALILGESGTGKNLVARAIHGAGEASRYRFVEVNCAALPASLLEAELFGYEKGAFTDARQTKKGLAEVADGGTLFLDEIGSMPPELQAKLLVFLESRAFRRIGGTREIEVDLRVVAATNANLEEDVAAGRFREDLFYRLNVAAHTLPPLREIRSDIPEMAKHFLRRAAEYFRRPSVPDLDEEGIETLQGHDWPGNARELRNVIERALIFTSGDTLEVPHLGLGIGAPSGPASRNGVVLPRGLSLDEVEKRYIEDALAATEGRVEEAAELLGVSRKVLWLRRKKHGLLD